MSIIITAVRNPKWRKAVSPDTGEEVDVIECEIQCNKFGDEWLPSFSALEGSSLSRSILPRFVCFYGVQSDCSLKCDLIVRFTLSLI